MKKTLFIGDIHGRTIWKDIINTEFPDEVIFVGDYFDSYEYEHVHEINNFLDIVALKKNPVLRFNGEVKIPKITMLIGNHDFQYLPGMKSYGECTGYQYNGAFLIEETLNTNREHLQVAYLVEDSVMCSHAGITKAFLKRLELEQEVNIAEALNDYLRYRPTAFGFYPHDHSGTGNHIAQGPLWIRPAALLGVEPPPYSQVVGHTKQSNVKEEQNIFFIDTLESGEYLVLLTDPIDGQAFYSHKLIEKTGEVVTRLLKKL
jgi:predicted phosphodiesterase